MSGPRARLHMEMSMPDNKLLRVPQDSPLVRRLDPTVETTAKPAPDWLVQARAELNRDASLKSFFVEAPDAAWAINNVTIRLAARWGGHLEEAKECVQYLWDEYQQLGQGIHLVSSETGKVVATLSEDDLWQPDPVPREDGSLAMPLPRIRPDLEGMIVSYISDSERERRILSTLARRAGQTDLLREAGDPRLLVATKAGRRQIVQDLAKYDAEFLLGLAGGTSRMFLQHFTLSREAPQDTTGLTPVLCHAYTRSVVGVQDQSTVNLRFDRAGALRAAMVQGWVREIARAVARKAHDVLAPSKVDASSITKEALGGAVTWVSGPSTLRVLAAVEPCLTILPVDGVEPTGLLGNVGTIVVPPEFETASLERFDRWETRTALEFTVWVNLDRVRALGVSGVAHQAVVF